jgi:hypothetical protein
MSDLFQTDMTWLDIAEQDPAPVSKSSQAKGIWQWSPEYRAKMREVQANLSAEVRARKSAKIRQSWLNTPNRLKPEVRDQIGQAVHERWHSTDPKWVAWRALQAQRRAERQAQQVTMNKQIKQIRESYDPEQRIQTHFGNFASWGQCVTWLQEQGVANPRLNLKLHRKAYPELYHVVLKRNLYKQIKKETK